MYSVNIKRQAGHHTLRTFLLDLRQDGPLEGISIDLIEKFTEAYDHARHDPTVCIQVLDMYYKHRPQSFMAGWV